MTSRVEFDPVRVLEVLDRHGVRFIVIGGLAASLLGSPSVTGDVDVCYDRAPDNLERLAAALKELGVTLRGAPPDLPFLVDARTLAAGDSFTFDTPFGPFDCLGTPSGTTGYAALVQHSQRMDLEGVTVQVASLDDLMDMKRAAGRPKDRVELEILGALRDVIEAEGSDEGSAEGSA